MLAPPDGVLLGATPGVVYGQAEEPLEPGDLLLLHTDGLVPPRRGPHRPDVAGGGEGTPSVGRLLGLAPRFHGARTAQDCVRAVVEEFGGTERADDACVLVARVVT